MSVSGSGLTEARQLYNMLQNVEDKLDKLNAKTKTVQSEVTKLKFNVHDLQLLMTQTAALMRRMGIGEDVVNAYARIQNIITAFNSLRVAMYALQVSAGPVGWLMLGIAGISAALAIQPSLMSNDLQNSMEAERVF